jgi:hypothetical protein
MPRPMRSGSEQQLISSILAEAALFTLASRRAGEGWQGVRAVYFEIVMRGCGGGKERQGGETGE